MASPRDRQNPEAIGKHTEIIREVIIAIQTFGDLVNSHPHLHAFANTMPAAVAPRVDFSQRSGDGRSI